MKFYFVNDDKECWEKTPEGNWYKEPCYPNSFKKSGYSCTIIPLSSTDFRWVLTDPKGKGYTGLRNSFAEAAQQLDSMVKEAYDNNRFV